MLLGLEIGMFIAGLIAVIRGQLKLTQKTSVWGVPARLAGLVLMVPVPAAFISGFAIGFQAAVDGRPLNLNDARPTFAAIEMGLTVICLLVAGLIVAISDKKPPVEHKYDKDGLPSLPPEVQKLLDNPPPPPAAKPVEHRPDIFANHPDAAWLRKDVSFEDAMRQSVPPTPAKPPTTFKMGPALVGVIVAAFLVFQYSSIMSKMQVTEPPAKAVKVLKKR